MATFVELQEKLKKLQHEKAVLLELVEHLEGNFIPSSEGKESKLKVILTEDNTHVPVEMVEEVLENVLLKRASDVQKEMDKILGTNFQPPTEQKAEKAPPQQPGAPVPQPIQAPAPVLAPAPVIPPAPVVQPQPQADSKKKATK